MSQYQTAIKASFKKLRTNKTIQSVIPVEQINMLSSDVAKILSTASAMNFFEYLASCLQHKETDLFQKMMFLIFNSSSRQLRVLFSVSPKYNAFGISYLELVINKIIDVDLDSFFQLTPRLMKEEIDQVLDSVYLEDCMQEDHSDNVSTAPSVSEEEGEVETTTQITLSATVERSFVNPLLESDSLNTTFWLDSKYPDDSTFNSPNHYLPVNQESWTARELKMYSTTQEEIEEGYFIDMRTLP